MPVVPTNHPADVISDLAPNSCSDVTLDVECSAVLEDGREVDCKSLQTAKVSGSQLMVSWKYISTNNCPFERVLARQSKARCSLCLPQGLQCTKDAAVFEPEDGKRYVVLDPYETVTAHEREAIAVDKMIPCMYTRDATLRIRTTNRLDSRSVTTDSSYTFVSPKASRP